jgi:putative methionine-R-sulfoxide reductase with GAF domain
MSSSDHLLLRRLREVVANTTARNERLQRIAALIREAGPFRWVGLYDVNRERAEVINIVWDGPGAPEFPAFPITKGLTASAIAERKVVNVGNVASDSRYLTAFGSTESEIIVPVFSNDGQKVVGTIDVESEQRDAFSTDVERMLVGCADVVRPLWG